MHNRTLKTLLVHAVLVAAFIAFVFPFLWMFFTAFKTPGEIFAAQFRLLPQSFRLSSFETVLRVLPFGTYMFNTFRFVFGLLVVQFFTITLAAYAFARLEFPFKNALFTILLVQLMLAPQTLIAPNYQTIRDLGLLDTVTAISLPYVASAMGVFLLRQGFKSIPVQMEEAARIDGASIEHYLARIAIPLIKPSYIAFALISINYHWNEFFWPLIITDTRSSRILTVGLGMFAEQSESAAAWNELMAATLMIIAPLLIIFLIFQKAFVRSFMTSGLKG